jgi:hypothetical protein
MAEEDTAAAPAGESGPLTESAAASLLAEWKDEPEEKSPKVDSSRANANAADDTPAEAEEEAEPAESTETDSEDGADPEADSDSEDSWVHGNARTRLRDGTAVTVGELKKLADEAKEFKRNQAEYTAQQQRAQQEVQAKAAQIAQQEHFFATTLQQAMAALQQQLPPEPDSALRETDPIDYFLKKDQRDQKITEIRNLQAAHEHAAQQSRAEQAQHFDRHLQQAQVQLYEKMPQLKNEGKRQEFYGELVSKGKEYYGFAKNEIDTIHDPRVMMMANDALAYRRLQANKPRVMEKGKAATPVAKPGVRTSSNERVSSKHKGLFEQARKTRSIDDVGKLLAELE